MRPRWLPILVLALAAPVLAQNDTVVTPRVSDRYWVWDRALNQPMQVVLDAGTRAAPSDADAAFDAVVSPDAWTNADATGAVWFDTFSVLHHHSTTVAPGRYRLDLRRTDGAWELGLVGAKGGSPAVVVPLASELRDGESQALTARVVDRTSTGFGVELAWGRQVLATSFSLPLPELPAGVEAPSERLKVMGGRTKRQALRVDLGNSEALQLAYNPVEWKADLAAPEALRAAVHEQAWRVGKNFWTEIESSRSMRVGGRWIGAGHYFVSVRAEGDTGWELCFHSPAKVRAASIDSYWSQNAEVFARQTLTYGTNATVSDPLEIQLVASADNPRFFDLTIAWGPHRLSTPLELGQGLQNQPVAGITHGWAQDEERDSTRLIFFDKTEEAPWNTSPGQVSIEFGRADWKDTYAALLDKSQATELPDDQQHRRRWRLGTNMWTNLDTRFPLRFGDVTVPTGYHYLMLEVGQTDFALLVVSPADLQGQRFDAWHGNRRPMPAPLRIPLTHDRVAEIATKLDIAFGLPGDDPRDATLQIRFGPHRLRAELWCEFEPTPQ